MLRINEVLVIPNAPDFNATTALEEYKKIPRPKQDFVKWLVVMGYVRIAPAAPVEKRKSRPVNPDI